MPDILSAQCRQSTLTDGTGKLTCQKQLGCPGCRLGSPINKQLLCILPKRLSNIFTRCIQLWQK